MGLPAAEAIVGAVVGDESLAAASWMIMIPRALYYSICTTEKK